MQQPTGQPPQHPPGYQPGYANQADYRPPGTPRPPQPPLGYAQQPPPSRYQQPPQGYQQPPYQPPPQSQYRGPAKMAHGPAYWTLVGWWWGPCKWAGRVLLWLAFWPIGLWRSFRHHQDTQAGKQRRGYR